MSEASAADGWIAAALAQAPEHGTVTVDGARIETRAWGARGKPGLLLLHGAGAHADWWSPIAPFLSAHYRVAAFSFSGMGGSDWRDSYTLDLFAEEAFATAEAAGLFESGEKPVFAAHSFGGRAALRSAAGARGGALKAVIAIDSLITPPGMDIGRRPYDAHNVKIYPTAEAAQARFRLVPAQPPGDPTLMAYIAERSVRPIDDPVRGRGWTWKFDPSVWEKLVESSTLNDLRGARCPVAAIRGERSALMIKEITEHFDANAPKGTPVVWVPEAHHHLMLDQPLAFVSALRALLAGWPI